MVKVYIKQGRYVAQLTEKTSGRTVWTTTISSRLGLNILLEEFKMSGYHVVGIWRCKGGEVFTEIER